VSITKILNLSESSIVKWLLAPSRKIISVPARRCLG
jgi:hypothetical protein